MRFHTTLTLPEINATLQRAKNKGRVANDIIFATLDWHGSQTHPRAWEIQLGTHDKYSLPAGTVDQRGRRQHVRRYKNSGNQGASSGLWAATWHEWGWFIAEIFAADPRARLGNREWGYQNPADFHAKTGNTFDELREREDLLSRTERQRVAIEKELDDRIDETVFGPSYPRKSDLY